ncbi:hypothetical protein RM531_03495 [Salinisphaera sp. P385]|uniref:Uncharacterized protein n=1 Tax=Spectribacter acetivorans TaxID=3075603 RepID=A0ABU3B507_9GAMM|nr:hypothetical protein [Salinisphaera sp. P385]MDT0617526.1 hypothetical protein [Salinisphaera sp. P385]
MDIQNFKNMVAREDRTGLLKLLKNVRKKNAPEFEDIVLERLDTEFPGWGVEPKGGLGGRKYNRAVIGNKTKEFQSAKEGFIWLAEEISHLIPHVFQRVDNHIMRFARGTQRNYFAPNPELLFPNSPHLHESQANYGKLSNGWYINTNLSNEAKFKVLLLLSVPAQLTYGKDWEWLVFRATKELSEEQNNYKFATEALANLFEELK